MVVDSEDEVQRNNTSRGTIPKQSLDEAVRGFLPSPNYTHKDCKKIIDTCKDILHQVAYIEESGKQNKDTGLFLKLAHLPIRLINDYSLLETIFRNIPYKDYSLYDGIRQSDYNAFDSFFMHNTPKPLEAQVVQK